MERTWWVSNSNLVLPLTLVKVSLLFFCVFVGEAKNVTINPHARIVGGSPVPIEEFPAFVAIFQLNEEIYCGGTYIQELWLIASAHCVVKMNEKPLKPIDPSTVKVRMGVTTYMDAGERRDVVEIVPHEKFHYNDTWTMHDIALLKVNRKFDLSKKIQLGRIIPKHPFPKEGVAVGYGVTKAGGGGGGNWKLVKVDLMITHETDWYLGTRSQKTEGPCHSDSGGPLYLKAFPTTVIGVVSYGTCSGGLTWFSNLYRYRKWIESKLPRSGETAHVLVKNRSRFVILVCYLTLLSLFVYRS